MNIFKRKLNSSDSGPNDPEPLALYQTLFHKEGYSYLRGIQEEVLTSWHKIRGQRDVLCKMNTGSGKTLVSLLMLYSKMVEGVGPSLYLCPDLQLLAQAKIQAELYGIPVCEIEQPGNVFPTDFLNSKSILLCTFQKVFNSRSIFDRDHIEVGSIVIDDAHVCLDKARSATTLYIPFGHELCERVLSLFEEDLKYQAPGTYGRLIDGDPYAKILKVPYWAWLDRVPELVELIGEFSEDDLLMFKWGLIADDLSTYACFIGPHGIEIAPGYVPYHSVRAFNEAKHRYILSATFEDQIDLIKDLGISKDSISNALIPKDRKDVGQRLILAPQRFDTQIDDEDIISLAQDYSESGNNVVVMVPSHDRALRWEEAGAHVINREGINDDIDKLKAGAGYFYVLVNRYDGVDLKGAMCYVLILDGYPSFSSYEQVYKEIRLESVKASLKAQIIEQGLGRAVRSGSDHCVVYMMGKDLLQFIGNKNNLQYFTPVTRQQLKLGLELLDDESKEDSLNTIKETANLCLVQDDAWRQYHADMLSNLDMDSSADRLAKNLEVAEIESKAISLFRGRNFQSAHDTILNQIIDSENLNLSNKQKAWYFEMAAGYLYQSNIPKSNDLQIKASSLAPHMLQPSKGHNYTKIAINEGQSSQVQAFIKKYENSQDLEIELEDLLADLHFSKDIPHTKFEHALADIGRFIGFHAQEPEMEFGNGPDVLWAMSDNHYLIMEAKSRATHKEITRQNIGQLLQSGEWFKKLYGPAVNSNLVTLQPPNIKGFNVNPSSDTLVMDEDCLNRFKDNLRGFIKGILSSGGLSCTNEDISKLLSAHKFTPAAFRSTYLKPIKTKKG